MEKLGRNDPCLCGSGKKYKQCCMNADLIQATQMQSLKQTISADVARAISLHQQGELRAAQELYEAVLKQQPEHPEALHFLGVLAYQGKNYDVAEDLMRRSINLDPTNAVYFKNLGAVYRDHKKLSKAIESQLMALELQPDYPQAYLNLGVAQVDKLLFTEAEHSFRQAIHLKPDYVEAWDNLGTALRLQHQFAAAIVAHKKALELNPKNVISYTNLAAIFNNLKQFDAAVEYCLKAVALDPAYSLAYFYLGSACMAQENFIASEQFITHALTLDPGNANAQYTLAMLLLGTGKLQPGWELHESRFTKAFQPIAKPYYPYPFWQGESLADKTILVWSEQGVGDQISFAEMVADLHASHCIIACKKKLVPLFAHSFPWAEVVDLEDHPRLEGKHIDVQSAAGSLGRWLRPDAASFPRRKAFLSADPERIAYWKTRLAALGDELTVGICWRSGNLVGERSLYCTQLDEWGAILSVPGVRFVNLQYDDCSAEIEDARERFGVQITTFAEVDLFDDLLENAALCKALDLVISAPTAAGILAAALGAPTWQLISGFEWQKFGGTENQFYATMKLFNKNWDQPWDDMINQIASELHSKVLKNN